MRARSRARIEGPLGPGLGTPARSAWASVLCIDRADGANESEERIILLQEELFYDERIVAKPLARHWACRTQGRQVATVKLLVRGITSR